MVVRGRKDSLRFGLPGLSKSQQELVTGDTALLMKSV